ncbi:MAG: VOC family protein [Ferruginibacter sp.]
MASINPYLNFPGNTEEVFNFYKSVFGGEFLSLQRFKDTPESDNIPFAVRDMIMHISLAIGTGSVLMATDAPTLMGFNIMPGNNVYICISPDSQEEATRLFNGLSEGGKITLGLQKMFWGAMYGDFTDKYGVRWMVNYTM